MTDALRLKDGSRSHQHAWMMSVTLDGIRDSYNGKRIAKETIQILGHPEFIDQHTEDANKPGGVWRQTLVFGSDDPFAAVVTQAKPLDFSKPEKQLTKTLHRPVSLSGELFSPYSGDLPRPIYLGSAPPWCWLLGVAATLQQDVLDFLPRYAMRTYNPWRGTQMPFIGICQDQNRIRSRGIPERWRFHLHPAQDYDRLFNGSTVGPVTRNKLVADQAWIPGHLAETMFTLHRLKYEPK